MMFDIITMGELLFDFSYSGKSPKGNNTYEANPGGAPANVAVGARRLGAATSFMGKIGGDALSSGLEAALNENGVDTSSLVISKDFNTALTFVQLDKKGDRSFTFYRNSSADMNITCGDIDKDILSQSRLFHFGSLTLTNEPSRSATIYAMNIAKKNGLMVSFDPNYRAMLWRNEQEAAKVIRTVLPYCDILKVSKEELQLLTGNTMVQESMRSLHDEFGIPMIFATFGSDGSAWLYQGCYGEQEAFDVKTVDTTGAGDSFVAAILYQIVCVYGQIKKIDTNVLAEIVRFASAASSLATTIPGAIPSLPFLADVEQLLK